MGFLVMLVLIVLAAGLVDLYSLLQTKTWAYNVATDAALQGVASGRDYGSLYASGSMALNPAVAAATAQAAAEDALAARGFIGYNVEVQVLSDPGGGTVADFPPTARAAPGGATTWTTTEPAVGVYLRVPVRTFFARLITGGDELPIHAFASAGLVEAH
ncbi:MAG: hypothetical protein KKB13_08615 [Chloroflexi bacterium]|nr:hypothetical protein [Chloroflexota bacterium]